MKTATVTYSIEKTSYLTTDDQMTRLEENLEKNGGKINSIENVERVTFGETEECKKVQYSSTGKAGFDNVMTEADALARFAGMRWTLEGKITNITVVLVEKETEKEAEEIVDAEEMLYEMDAHRVDELIIEGGYSKNRTITRKQVLEQLEKRDLSFQQVGNVAQDRDAYIALCEQRKLDRKAKKEALRLRYK